MHLKNPNFFSQWVFYMDHPLKENHQVRVPASGYANSNQELTGKVIDQIASFDEATDGEYSKKERAIAKSRKMSFKERISKIVEHQICLRNGGNDLCYDDGFGDKLHHAAEMVDKAKKSLPRPARKIADTLTKAATTVATGHASRNFGTCQTCGGTTSYNPGKDNTGRAGKVNRLVTSVPGFEKGFQP